MFYQFHHRSNVRNCVFIYRWVQSLPNTDLRQEGASEWYLNTVKDLANAVSQKDEKLHTAGLDDTAKPHIKKKIPKYRLKKNSIPQLFNTVNPHAPL